jgi:capsular polysaccharide biosynthesis protein
MTTGERSQRRDVPLPIDLAGHIRDLAAAFIPALLVALAVGGAVFGLRTALAEKEYSATIVTQVIPGSEVVGGDIYIEQLRAPFIALANDDTVLKQVLSTVDVGWNARTLSENIETTKGSSPNVLDFTVTAGSPEQAQEIVQSLVTIVGQAAIANHNRDTTEQIDQLKAAIAAEEAHLNALANDDPEKAKSNAALTDLRANLARAEVMGFNRLTVLATPEPDRKPVSPKPINEGLVAGLVSLIVSAELIVTFRSRAGKKVNDAWARRIARKFRAVYETADPAHPELPPLASSALAYNLSVGRTALVLRGSAPTAEAPELGWSGSDNSTQVSESNVSDAWWHGVDLSKVGLAIVVISEGSIARRDITTSLTQLRDLDLPSYLVLRKAEKVSPRKRRHGD